MNIQKARSVMLYFGILSMISAAVWISTAIAINPSFDFYTGALSQLGSLEANSPWVYNVGLKFTSVLLFVFACSLLLYSRNRIESAWRSFLMISSLFLAYIGKYPEREGNSNCAILKRHLRRGCGPDPSLIYSKSKGVRE